MMKFEEKVADLADELAAEVDAIGMEVATSFTVADAMREGAKTADQAYDWTDEEGNLCALSAAAVSAKARKYL